MYCFQDDECQQFRVAIVWINKNVFQWLFIGFSEMVNNLTKTEERWILVFAICFIIADKSKKKNCRTFRFQRL